jgi:MFS family permease
MFECFKNDMIAVHSHQYSYDTGTIGGILAMPFWRNQFSTGYINTTDHLPDISASQSSMIVSLLSAGTFFGALTAAPTGDFFGRRLGLMVSMAVFVFGVVLQTASSAIPLFVAGRFFAGYGVGMISALSESPLLFTHKWIMANSCSPSVSVGNCSKVDPWSRRWCLSIGHHNWSSPRRYRRQRNKGPK